MNLIDMHCDTLARLTQPGAEGDLLDNDGAVSIRYLEKEKSLAQFFACFIWRDGMPGHTDQEKYEAGYRKALELADYMKEQTVCYQDHLELALSAEDPEKIRGRGKIAAVLTIEEGGILNGHIERLDQLYEKGIRLMTLMWNYENCLGFPGSRDPHMMEQGLKPFGHTVLERMNDLGMIVDVSHASDGVFYDVVAGSRKPVVASHSNCRALAGHPRNLTDEMLRLLGEKGGAAGLNFFGPFLGTEKESRLEEMAAHILHMIQKGGADLPAIGTDFDGFDGMEKMDIPNTGCMERLWSCLHKKGLSEDQLDRIWYRNVLRVWKENQR